MATLNVGPSKVTLTYPTSWKRYDTEYTVLKKSRTASECQSTLTNTFASSPTYDYGMSVLLQTIAMPLLNNTKGTGYRALLSTIPIASAWAQSAFPGQADLFNCDAAPPWGRHRVVVAPPVIQTLASTIDTATIYHTSSCSEPCGATTNSVNTAFTFFGPPRPPITIGGFISVPTSQIASLSGVVASDVVSQVSDGALLATSTSTEPITQEYGTTIQGAIIESSQQTTIQDVTDTSQTGITRDVDVSSQQTTIQGTT